MESQIRHLVIDTDEIINLILHLPSDGNLGIWNRCRCLDAADATRDQGGRLALGPLDAACEAEIEECREKTSEPPRVPSLPDKARRDDVEGGILTSAA